MTERSIETLMNFEKVVPDIARTPLPSINATAPTKFCPLFDDKELVILDVMLEKRQSVIGTEVALVRKAKTAPPPT